MRFSIVTSSERMLVRKVLRSKEPSRPRSTDTCRLASLTICDAELALVRLLVGSNAWLDMIWLRKPTSGLPSREAATDWMPMFTC